MNQCGLKSRLLLILCLSAAVMISSCTAKSNQKKTVNVVASILPVADFVRHVGGEYVSVETLVPPNISPHVFEPTPRELKLVSGADLLVVVGLGLEFWKDKMVEASANPRMRVLDLSSGVGEIIGSDEHDEGHGAGGGKYGNPHIWLSPRIAEKSVDEICRALSEIDRAHAAVYQKNAAVYRSELEALDREITEKVRTFKDRRFVSQHAAWVYFARDYGLEQVGAIETTPGKEPTPVEIKNLVALLKRIKAKAVFTEPQFSPKAAEVLAEECGISVLTLSLMGAPPKYDYIEMMRYNVNEIAKALQ